MATYTSKVLTSSLAKLGNATYYGRTTIGTRKPPYEFTKIDPVGNCHIKFSPVNPINTYTIFNDAPRFTIQDGNVCFGNYKKESDDLKVSLGTLKAGTYVIKAKRSDISDAAAFTVYVADAIIATTGDTTDREIRLEFTLAAASEVVVKLVAFKFATGSTLSCALIGLSITTAATEPKVIEEPKYIEMPYEMKGIPVSDTNTLKTYQSSVDGKYYIADTCVHDGSKSYYYKRVANAYINEKSNFKFVDTADTESYVLECEIPNMAEIADADYDSILCNALSIGHVDDASPFDEVIMATGKKVRFRIKKSRIGENATISDIKKFFTWNSMLVQYPLATPAVTDLEIHLFQLGFMDYRTYTNGTLVETLIDGNNNLHLDFEITES